MHAAIMPRHLPQHGAKQTLALRVRLALYTALTWPIENAPAEGGVTCDQADGGVEDFLRRAHRFKHSMAAENAMAV